MKAQGFTLVELLAVIVILAVLALIATPVVLSIIDDAKESAMLRSAEMYLSGVENAVMRENMNSGGNFRPNECTISNGNMTCGSTNVEVEVDGEVPYAGSIVFENGKIKEVTLNYESGTIVKDASGNLVYSDAESEYKSICTLASDSTVAAGEYGAKYDCKVDPNKEEYTFYLLDNNEDGTSDLIMSHNINESGENINSNETDDFGLVAWYADAEDDSYGPITAMNYLYNATKSWTNVDPLDFTYNNLEYAGEENESYRSFVSVEGIGVIQNYNETTTTIGTTSEPLRARMPVYIYNLTYQTLSEVADENNNNSFLYNNLDPSMATIYTYWTMTSVSYEPGKGYVVYKDGDADGNGIYDEDGFISGDFEMAGVRPVITVKL